MSKPVMYQFSRALSARMSHTVSNLTTGEKISLKSIPLICENPLTTSCAFFWLSVFWSKTYHKWSLTICDGCFDTLKSSKM